jgi:MYXO-CTERM domain-containing protein
MSVRSGAVLALTACVPQISTELGQLTVTARDLSLIGDGDGPAALLPGTVTCPEIVCAADCPPTANALDCFDVGATGSAVETGGCFTLGDPGAASWTFDPVPCPANDEGYAPVADRLVFDVIDPAAVTAAPLDVEALVESSLSPGPGVFPSDWHQPLGEPWRLAAGSPFTFHATLVGPGGAPVGYTIAQGGAQLGPFDGTSPELTNVPGGVQVAIEAGATAQLRWGVGARSWPLVDVVGVPRADAASIQVVVAYLADANGVLAPAGARAIVRDGTGRLIWGMPVDWTLDDGVLAVGDPYVALPGPDYVTLLDRCVPPSQNHGDHAAVIRATAGGLTAVGTVAWTVPDGAPDSDEGFVASEACPHTPETPEDSGSYFTGAYYGGFYDDIGWGCGCTSGAGSPGVSLVVVAAAVAARRRRMVLR